jgi:predicted dehydrogenase
VARAPAVKQVAQRARDGTLVVVDAPRPLLRPGWVLVQNRASLISAGTERSKVALGEKNLVQKARARPDLVKKVVDRARDQGLRSTVDAVRDRLESLSPIGYSSAGVVLEVGERVESLAVGDRVACGGGGWANHAEIVAVPRNLVAKLPAEVSYEVGAYATVGAIALHALRQGEAAVGESVGIVGLGLVGQLAASLALAAGCTVVGVDLDPAAVRLAQEGGASAFHRDAPELDAHVARLTHGRGLDVLLVCAAAPNADPLALAARLARDRGRIVVVGDLPLAVDRSVAYAKELEIILSRSYGPGRYDADYEERGRDLPPGYVRWTEQRNIQAFVDLVARGRLEPTRLTTHRFPIERAADAYALLAARNGAERSFGIVLEYAESPSAPPPAPARGARNPSDQTVGVAFVGVGNFARGTLLPAFKAEGARLVAVSSQSGLTAADAEQRFGFERTASGPEEIFGAEDVDAVVIATRHASHAELVRGALEAGKAVFVEKPLAVTPQQLDDVESALRDDSLLMVGFNRRFAPLTRRLQEAYGTLAPDAIVIRANAGALPPDHWLHDPDDGGGRLVGEGCHFVDLAITLARSRPLSVYAAGPAPADGPIESADTVSLTLRFENGAVAHVLYTGAGDTRLAKEHVEAFGGGRAAVLDDFRRLEVYAGGKPRTVSGRQDKGHRAQIHAFLDAVRGAAPLPDPHSYMVSMRATFAALESLRTGTVVSLADGA